MPLPARRRYCIIECDSRFTFSGHAQSPLLREWKYETLVEKTSERCRWVGCTDFALVRANVWGKKDSVFAIDCGPSHQRQTERAQRGLQGIAGPHSRDFGGLLGGDVEVYIGALRYEKWLREGRGCLTYGC